MSVMEIVLILMGIIIFAGSFLIPVRKETQKTAEAVDEKLIRDMVEKEVQEAQTRITDIVDETISYAMEKTERSMDRLTNEKMLAVSEYSDTVLGEINKNHQEVVFLYDMLNDKHENIKTTATEVEKTAKKVQETVKEAETQAEISRQQKETEVQAETFRQQKETEAQTEAPTETFVPMQQEKLQRVTAKSGEENNRPMPDAGQEVPEVTVTVDRVGSDKRNNNERILELHRDGRSNMAIAKELGLGIGEVKLVIDLFEGM